MAEPKFKIGDKVAVLAMCNMDCYPVAYVEDVMTYDDTEEMFDDFGRLFKPFPGEYYYKVDTNNYTSYAERCLRKIDDDDYLDDSINILNTMENV